MAPRSLARICRLVEAVEVDRVRLLQQVAVAAGARLEFMPEGLARPRAVVAALLAGRVVEPG